MPKYPKAYYTACQIQNILMQKISDPRTSALAVAQLSRAWNEIEERKRILAGKPLPKSVDVTKLKEQKQTAKLLGILYNPTQADLGQPETIDRLAPENGD